MARTTKNLYLLNIGNFAPRVCQITYPLIYGWADKIGAKIIRITERKFPEWPVVYEKLQIYQLSAEHPADWHIYLDSDALLHPDLPDLTVHVPFNTVCHNGADPAAMRWEADDYFYRDGRWIASCNWFTMASRWCRDLWRPHDDLTPAEAIRRIHPTVEERTCGVLDASHLVDDYSLSRNIARFGLKFTTFQSVLEGIGFPRDRQGFLWHAYTIPIEEKVVRMHEVLRAWGIINPQEAVVAAPRTPPVAPPR